MSTRTMGSEQTDEIPAKEVAKLLQVDIRTLQSMVRQGLLQPSGTSRRVGDATMFRVDEVAAYADLRFKKLDLSVVASMAMRAYVVSKANERKVSRISDLLGLDLPALETDETSIVQLFVEAEDHELEEKTPTTLAEIRRWAGVLFSIDEAYLKLVEHHTGCPEPWKPFFDVAQRILEGAPARSVLRLRDTEASYSYLTAAQRHFRGVMYFYYRMKNGRRAADQAFPEMDDQGVEAELAAILYPR